MKKIILISIFTFLNIVTVFAELRADEVLWQDGENRIIMMNYKVYVDQGKERISLDANWEGYDEASIYIAPNKEQFIYRGREDNSSLFLYNFETKESKLIKDYHYTPHPDNEEDWIIYDVIKNEYTRISDIEEFWMYQRDLINNGDEFYSVE